MVTSVSSFLLGISFAVFLSLPTQAQDTTQKVVPNRQNAPKQLDKPYVILISADGFRYDYTKKYHAQHLKQLAEKGVMADALIPSFPSITFPNHYTIVTGLYPAHHGLVGNNMYDPKMRARYSMSNAKAVKDPIWYGGIPIWTLAEQEGLLSASYYWPGSEAAIGGMLPSYYYAYNDKIPIEKRIQTVVNWLTLPEEKRPHIINFYFPQVDHAGHLYGPDAPETAQAVHFVDSAVNVLNMAVQQTGLPVNFIFVSDHGMKAIKQNEPLQLPFEVDTTKVTLASNGTLVNIHVKDKKNIPPLYQSIQKSDKFDVYLSEEVPSRYHYGKKDDQYQRIGDILLFAKAPYYFSNKKPHPGAHGFDPYETREMQATFIAWGPAFKEGLKIGAFENVDIYPLLAKLLGLTYKHRIDGNDKIAKKILK
ncbi:ectonucleotide pyrophosphatase/phosphodiesterase [Olivibacter sp. CPCC 100613]|uniref:alkaline phosphatase family protein n=1 Tax=Olivibacter sp. CPCC 100613 TaxID=3079931 RepID=UPI002FF5A991